MAVGSSIGHAIGGMFGGGSSAPAEQQQSDSAVAGQANNEGYQSNQWGARSCENDAKVFTKCLDENQGNMQICGWYLDQLVISLDLRIVCAILIFKTESVPICSQSILERRASEHLHGGGWCVLNHQYMYYSIRIKTSPLLNIKTM